MVVLSDFLAPGEAHIKHQEPDTTLYINQREIGNGTLYITESLLSWLNVETQKGFSMEYPHISLHALSRDESAHHRHCLYVMVDAKVDLPGDQGVAIEQENMDDDGSDDSDGVITELRFAPRDVSHLDAMYQAMSHCQALHPDPNDSYSDAEDDDIYEDADEDFEYRDPVDGFNGLTIRNGREEMDLEAGQFEDAEEDP